MKDFRSYSNDGADKSNQGENIDNRQTSQSSPQLDGAVEMAKIISRAMNGKSTAQIFQTIIAEAERGKRAGTLTNADLDNFYSALYPILDGMKRRKLKEVISRLKDI